MVKKIVTCPNCGHQGMVDEKMFHFKCSKCGVYFAEIFDPSDLPPPSGEAPPEPEPEVKPTPKPTPEVKPKPTPEPAPKPTPPPQPEIKPTPKPAPPVVKPAELPKEAESITCSLSGGRLMRVMGDFTFWIDQLKSLSQKYLSFLGNATLHQKTWTKPERIIAVWIKYQKEEGKSRKSDYFVIHKITQGSIDQELTKGEMDQIEDKVHNKAKEIYDGYIISFYNQVKQEIAIAFHNKFISEKKQQVVDELVSYYDTTVRIIADNLENRDFDYLKNVTLAEFNEFNKKFVKVLDIRKYVRRLDVIELGH